MIETPFILKYNKILYSLRHSYASLLIERGEKYQIHSNTVRPFKPYMVTLNVYAHLRKLKNLESTKGHDFWKWRPNGDQKGHSGIK